MVVKTQSWIEFWNFSSIFFFECLSRKTLDRFFIFLTPLFLLYKPQLLTKQIGLTNQFVIPWRNLWCCIQKIKNKHDSGADVVFFTYACATHSIVRDWLCYSVTKTKTLGMKKRNSEETCFAKWKKKLPGKKNLFKVKQITWQWRTTDLHFFILLILNRFLSAD